MECPFCKNNKKTLIKKYKYWTILLGNDQRYLGRCIIKLNRHIIDLFDITDKEKKELFEITKKLRIVLKNLFKPDIFNYASFGNFVEHLHMHLVPRYKNKRIFERVIFKDNRWGKNYAPYKKRKLPKELSAKLINLIRQNIQKL